MSKLGNRKLSKNKPSKKEAEEAVRTLLSWAGDDPDRQGLKDTPARVVRAYTEWFKGYGEDPEALLRRTFDETGGYDEIVTLRDIPFESFLRTPSRADHRICPCRIPSERPRSWNIETGSHRGRLRQASPDFRSA